MDTSIKSNLYSDSNLSTYQNKLIDKGYTSQFSQTVYSWASTPSDKDLLPTGLLLYLANTQLLFQLAAVNMFSKRTAFQLAAEVEAACVLCGLNFLVSMPACCITVLTQQLILSHDTGVIGLT